MNANIVFFNRFASKTSSWLPNGTIEENSRKTLLVLLIFILRGLYNYISYLVNITFGLRFRKLVPIHSAVYIRGRL